MAAVTGVTRDGVRDYFRVNRRPQQISGLIAGADNTATITNAIANANAYDTLVIPEGDWTHSTAIQHAKANITVEGYGARLLATNPRYAGYHITGAGTTIRGITHEVVGATARGNGENIDDCPWMVDQADGVTLEDIISIGARDAQFFMFGATNLRLRNLIGRNSFADGLHISYGCKNVVADGVEIINPGDDGVAVVSYVNDPRPCSNIRVSRIGVVNSLARGITIVGGTNVTYSGFRVTRSRGAGIYIAHEQGDYNTSPVTRALISNGEVLDANWDSALDQGAIGLFNLVSGTVMDTVAVSGVTVRENRKDTQSKPYIVIKSLGGSGGRYRGVTLSDINMLGGTGRAALYAEGATAATVVNGGYTYASQSGTGVTTNSEGFVMAGGSDSISASGTTTAAPGLTVTRVREGALYATT